MSNQFFGSDYSTLTHLKGLVCENGQNYQISVFCSKSVFRYGGITSQISRGLAALEPSPPKNRGEKGGKGGGVRFFPFSIENEKENGKKIFRSFCRKSFKDSKTVYIYIYIYIYIKLSPKWKKCNEQKVFRFRLYILCENFSKIGAIIKKYGAKGVLRGSKFDFFQYLISLLIHLFI